MFLGFLGETRFWASGRLTGRGRTIQTLLMDSETLQPSPQIGRYYTYPQIKATTVRTILAETRASRKREWQG
jgi:hypothetical protein